MQGLIRRSIVVPVAIAVLLSGVLFASSIRAWAAPPEAVARVKTFLATELANWSQDLDTVGALADSLPLVTASPGALLGADDLIGSVIANNIPNLDDGTETHTLPDGRVVKVVRKTTDTGAGWRLDITADITRTVDDLDLRLTDEDSGVDVSVTAGVSAEVSAQVKLSIQEDGTDVWLIHDAAPTTQTPRIDIGVEATLTADAKAAIGILGVTLTESSLLVKYDTSATFDDPNNDGKLAFVGNGAELAEPGSLEGLVKTELQSTSSISGGFVVAADTSMTIPGFPTSVSATVAVNWPDITVGEPTFEVTGFDDALALFQNLSLQNLADGLARVITTINSIQQRVYDDGGTAVGNLDLPFMRGTLADAIEIVGPLKDFLTDNVWSGDEIDPARLGTPKFSSLQDLLSRLDDTMDLGDVEWDAANNKFVIPLNFSHSAAAEEPLDKSPEPAEGDDPATTQAHTGAITFADQLQVGGSGIFGANAEASLAMVKASHQASVTIVLDLREPVTGQACAAFTGQPCPFDRSVGGMNLTVDEWPLMTDRIMLRTGENLYSANLPITSDIDFSAKAGYFGLNLTGDLVMCSTAQDEDCSGEPPASTPMIAMALKAMGDAQHDVRLSELVDTLVQDPGSLLDPQVNIRARATAKITVPNLEGFLPEDAMEFSIAWADLTDPSGVVLDTSKLDKLASLNFDPDNPQALFNILLKQLQVFVAGLAEANPAVDNEVFNAKIPGLGRSLRELLLSDEANGGDGVTFGANTIVDATRTGADRFTDEMVGRIMTVGTQVNVVRAVSADGTTLQMLDEWATVPFDGTRYNARAALLDALDRLVAENPSTIQDFIAKLNERLDGIPLKARYLDGTTPSIVLDLDWDRHYRVDTPLNWNFDALGGLVSAATAGQAQARVNGAIKVGLVVPLSLSGSPGNPAQLKIMQDSSISVHAAAEATDGVVTASLAGLSLSLGDPAAGGEKATVKADLGVGIGVPGATGTPVTWGEFFGAAKVSLNPAGQSVSCESGLDAELSVCAHLPLFAKGLADEYTDIGALNLRLPRTGSLSDLSLSGNLPAPNATVPRLEYPADLPDRIADAVLDFSSFEPGIDGYLAVAEAGLRLASFDGKIPLVGDDLQQGADFIGNLRKTLKEDVLGGLGGETPKDWVAKVNQRLTDELAEAGLTAINPQVGLECSAALEPVGAPTLTAVPEPDPVADGVSYEYKIVATQPGSDTVPGDAAIVLQKALSAANTVTLAWESVTGATGYKVLRRAPGETDFVLVHSGTELTFTDTGAEGVSYAPVSSKPPLEACPLEAVTGVNMAVTIRQQASSASRPLDLGLPGLSLKAERDNGNSAVEATFAFELHLKVGLNRIDGFYVATQDGWGGSDGLTAMPELGVEVAVHMPDTLQAKLAFIGVDIESKTPAPMFSGKFQVDLKAPGGPTCFDGCAADANAKLRMTDLAAPSQLFAVSLTGDVLVDWTITSRIEVNGDPNLLPGIAVDFKLTWGFDNNSPSSMGLPDITFNNFKINAGDVFSEILGPILEKVKLVTEPLQPIIDAIYAPLPVLSDVSKAAGGGDISLFTLANTFSTLAGGPKLEMVQRLADVITLLNSLPNCGGGVDCMVPLGSFKVKAAEALTTTLTPDVAASLIQDANPNASTLSDFNAKAGGSSQLFDPAGGDNGRADKAGIKFPIFQKPANAFALLLGGDVDLVTFDSGPLQLGFSFSQEFGPVYAPPPVLLTLSGSASITARVRAGMDTYGIRKAIEHRDEGLRAAVHVVDGLYFATNDEQGRPLPVVLLRGEIAAGAQVSVLIASVGIEGGLGLTIGMYWNDPNDDGKFRVSEFVTAALRNPMCLFEAAGKVYLFLRLNLKIGFSIFAVRFSVTLAQFTLLDFSVAADCDPPPPELGGVHGDTLYVFTGALGGDDFRGDGWGATDDEESVKVTQLHFAQTAADPEGTDPGYDGMKVQLLGITREFHNPGIERVVVDGTGAPAALNVTFSGDGQRVTDGGNAQTTSFNRAVYVLGSEHADKITAGSGPARIDGAGGDDIITTADTGLDVPGIGVSDAWVAGNAGHDNIVVGDGDNKVAGDATLGFTKNPEALTLLKAVDASSEPKPVPAGRVIVPGSEKDPLQQPDGAAGNDTIRVGLGTNTVNGNGGDDVISVVTAPGVGSPKGNILIGGQGSDRLNGGAGDDVIYTGPAGNYGLDGEGPDDDAPNGNIVNSGAGNDIVWGSKAVDYLTSGSLRHQSTRLVGGGGDDVLVGGLGSDALYGGPGHDYLVAEPADIGDATGADHIVAGVNYGPVRAVTMLPLSAGVTPNTKTLIGGLGNDHIYGGDGGALIFGDTYIAAEKCRAGDPVPSDPLGESTSAATGDGNDFVVGGSGVDIVSAGGGDDRVAGGSGDDLLCGQEGNDWLDGQDGDDHLWGGTGNDTLWGGTGDDAAFGNDGNDTLFGGAGEDILEGNAGDDWISGGTGDDTIIGGTRAAGRDDGADLLYGDAGADRIIGDNATATAPYVPVDLETVDESSTLGGPDIIWGGDGDDIGFGGLGDDTLHGNAGADLLEGNNGSDTIYGGSGDDMLIGGSSQVVNASTGRPDAGDRIYGDSGNDLIAGDNAIIKVVALSETHPILRNRISSDGRSVVLLDRGDAPAAGTSGADEIHGGSGADVILGQGGNDRLIGNAGDDLIEGGAGSDWIEGNAGDDDLIGGSSWVLSGTGNTRVGQPDEADAIFGGAGDDVLLGDNGRITRPSEGEGSTAALTRMGSTGQPMTPRLIELYDLGPASPQRHGADRLSGGAGVDAIWGQDGDDIISGDGGGDYIEGNGGADLIRGDLPIGAPSAKTPDATLLPDPGWPGAPSAEGEVMGPQQADGQDDIIGGSSRPGFRDGADIIEGNGGDDVILGDNGTLIRVLKQQGNVWREAVYTERYPIGAVPADATRVRAADPSMGQTTRFCTAGGSTCEPVGAFGADVIYGDDGDDGIWGQDGDDTIHGGAGNDEIYGELGDDRLFGDEGDDVILGDRGGVATTYLDGNRGPAEFSVTLKQPPKETYRGFQRGKLDRRVDLMHDTNGGVFLGSGKNNPMPHPGTTVGGRDRIRGGLGSDVIFAGYGDDLVNGDSGGDVIFGGDGEDVLWGGRGCDPVADAATADCLVNGQFDPSARGDGDRFVDYIFGGAGELDPAKQDVLGADILDWRPRGGYANCVAGDWPKTVGKQTNDPCVWFEMTNTDDDDVDTNQHHHGVDWIYGGLDRDVLQGDVTGNGPNGGDRLMDTGGNYNLFSHCNAAYGGFNDIRVNAPALRDFLFEVAYASGAGQTANDVTTSGTSAFVDLAMVYNGDNKRANGKPFPGSPGHFDQGACEP